MKRMIVLSGPIAAGKSALAAGMAEQYGARIARTREYLTRSFERAPDRQALQDEGDRLDSASGGRWIIEAVRSSLPDENPGLVVVDAVRIHEQVKALREAYGRAVVHVHLRAPLATLEERYDERRAAAPSQEFASYDNARENVTEAGIHALERDADVIIDTSRSRPEDVLTRAVAQIGLSGSRQSLLVDVMVGGQYGSEGKGNVAAYLAPDYGLLVRSGGPNAGHSVWAPKKTQIQHHLPSGTTVSAAQLLLSPGAVLHPAELLEEIADSGVSQGRLSIDPSATVIEDGHTNEEGALINRIGSTGAGVGAATAGRIMGRSDPPTLAGDVPELEPYLRSAAEVLAQHYALGSRILVEGTQGTGLSLLHGRYPYVTSRDTTVSGVLAEAGVPPGRVRKVIMVVRTYPIRVADPPDSESTSGPLGHEITWEEIADRSTLDLDELLAQELTTRTKNLRRVGEFEWDQLAQAAQLNGPTDLALTFVDQLDASNKEARRFDQLTPDTIQFIEEVERVAGTPVTLISTRFHQRSVIDRRNW